MKARLPLSIVTLLLLAASAPSQAAGDDIKYLLCSFQHGQLKVEINYTAETVNGVTAIIDDKEIVWKPPGKQSGLAVINRYTGVMQMSLGGKQDTGMCTRMILKQAPEEP
jgi:heat shock protein HslJ